MEPSLFKYILRHSRKQQLWIAVIVFASMPFVLLSYELPKQIVNGPIQGEGFDSPTATADFLRLAWEPPSFIYDGELVFFSGFDMERLPYLVALCIAFLGLVCINGLFKFYINTYKGRIGERMLRRLRYELLDRVLRFPIAHFKRVKAPEVATMIKDEVEPLGEFIGDAFSLPLFQASQAAIALAFIVMQNYWLGGIALVVVLGQTLIIPRLRRQLLVLMKRRQLMARALSGRVGEIVDGIAEVHVNDTTNYERADLANRLGQIFFIRYELFQRKYFIKFLNNFLAQFTPFLFYLVGGYFAIRGSLDIGQLIAVIAAYKDLPSPIRELINWDQKRLDVQIKYSQVIEQFETDNMVEPDRQSIPDGNVVLPLEGQIEVSNVGVTDDTGAKLLERATFKLPLQQHAAAVGLVNSGAETIGDVLAGLAAPTAGRAQVGQYNVEDVPAAVIGRRVAYVGVETYLPQASVIDSVLYGLKHAPLQPPTEDSDNIPRTLEIAEARRAGNSILDIDANWIDFEAAGVKSAGELQHRVHKVLEVVELDQDIFDLGLRGTIDPEGAPELAESVMKARTELRERLLEAPLKDLVDPFDHEKYNHQATLGENLMFGTAVGDTFADANLASNAYMLGTLEKSELDGELFNMGRGIAETVAELFSDLPEDHPFFEQLSFMSSEEIPEYKKVLTRTAGVDFANVKAEDISALLKLSFAYIEPRHRLGLMTDELEAKILKAREMFRENLPEENAGGVEFYDEEAYNQASSLQDNILFGRVSYGMAQGPARIGEEIQKVLTELDLRDAVFQVGLRFNVGTGGKRLNALQRSKIGLARAMLKNPDLMVVNRALSSLDTRAHEKMIKAVMEVASGGESGHRFGLFWVLQNAELARNFEHVLVFEDGALVEEGEPVALAGSDSKLSALVG